MRSTRGRDRLAHGVHDGQIEATRRVVYIQVAKVSLPKRASDRACGGFGKAGAAFPTIPSPADSA
jgi:hypothetical protein